MATDYGTCTAVALNSSQPCTSLAIDPNPPFCGFHKKQCQALYEGHKKRSAELDELENAPPARSIFKNLVGVDFGEIKDVATLTAIHDFLLRKYSLLNRCVLARAVHHYHFYRDSNDFGHQNYLNWPGTGKNLLVKALKKVELRMVALRYEHEQWYSWVRNLQANEERRSVSEKERVMAAAELEKKQKANILILKAEEENKHCEALENEEVWDPLEFSIGVVRMGYIALVRTLLKDQSQEQGEKQVALKRAEEIGTTVEEGNGLGRVGGSREEIFKAVMKRWKRTKDDFVVFYDGDSDASKEDLDNQRVINNVPNMINMINMMKNNLEDQLKGLKGLKEKTALELASGGLKPKKTGKKAKKRNKSKSKQRGEGVPTTIEDIEEKEKKLVKMLEKISISVNDSNPDTEDQDTEDLEEKKPENDMRLALHDLWSFVEEIRPKMVEGDTKEDFEKAKNKIIDLTKSIREYQLLRLVLCNPLLMSVALECNSIDDFLNDTKRISNTGLRDLALGLSKSSMQNVRNACADYWLNECITLQADAAKETLAIAAPKKSADNGRSKAEEEEAPVGLNRVKVCGRWVHSYPMESRLPRRGWFQFGLLTGASWSTAMSLTNSWDEAFEFSLLGGSCYFRDLPFDWIGLNDPLVILEMRRIGFLAYARSSHADIATKRIPVPDGGYMDCQARNYICGNMARNDPRARRFIKMVTAATSQLLIWVKDMKTGEIIYKPPKDQLWINRIKLVGGRSPSRFREWNVAQAMNTKFREQTNATRPWKFGFSDYMEVHIWDMQPGRLMQSVIFVMMKLLNKAYFNIDTISLWDSTMDVFQRITIEEEGPEGPKAIRAREIRNNLKALRKRDDLKDILKKSIAEFFYNKIDESLDKAIMP